MPRYGEKKDGFKFINKSYSRVDAAAKVTGKAPYAADLVFAHMLYGGAKYSPYAHAKVKSIDISKAEAMPGVAAVLTYKDLVRPASWGYYTYMTETIRYEADAVAIVAAENKQILAAALDAIEVEYEELPGVYDIDAAMAEGAPLVHEEVNDKGVNEYAGNIWSHAWHKVNKGDVEEAFKNCDRIIERTYTTDYVEHCYLETEAVVAVPDTLGGMTGYCGCANPFFARRWVADGADIPRPKARIMQTYVGGSFGGKEELLGVCMGRACMLAKKTGRPVKLVTTREESFKGSTKRHPFRMEYKVGVNNDGKLQAVEVLVTEKCGAYHMHEFMNFRAKIHAGGCYAIPNFKSTIKGVVTNTVTSGAMRGYSSPQLIFGEEQLYEEVAQELGMDPIEFKKLNLLKKGDIHPCGQEMKQEVILPEMIDTLAEETDFFNKRAAYENQTGTIRKGIGMSIFHRGCGLGGESPDNSSAMVCVHDDGTVMLNVGLSENGQGIHTAYTQILAEALHCDPSLITINRVDTHTVGDSGITAASRCTVMGAQSVKMAAEKILQELINTAANIMFHCPPEAVVCEDGFFKIAGVPDAMIPWQVVCECHFWTGGQDAAMEYFKAPPVFFDNEKGIGDGFPTYAYGVVVAEVAIDLETGQIKVEKVTSGHDLGTVINPENAEAQIQGGIAMGVGFASMEDLRIVNGHITNLNFDKYMIPSLKDVPEMKVILFEDDDPTGTYGAKSLGEPATEGVGAAVALAIRNALKMNIPQIPINKVKLYEMLYKKDNE